MNGDGTEGARVTVAHVDTESGFSGGQVQVFLLLEGLRERGVRSVLCCPPGSRSEQEARARGLHVRTVPMRNDFHLSAVPRLASIFREVDADVVHLHTGRANALGGWAGRLAGRPAITTRRQDRKVRGHPLNRVLYGWLVQRAVAISPAIAVQLADGGVSPDKIAVIPSAVDPAALLPSRPRDETRAALGLGADEVALLVLAQLTRRKGVDVLLEALTLLPESPERRYRLLVAGEGPERAPLQASAAALGLADHVGFLGRREDASDLLAAADVFVMPSRAEGLGIAALEAMACGCPVLATDVGGLGEAVVADRTGLLVPPDDAAALAAALQRLIQDQRLRARLGEQGPHRVAEGFLAGQMVDAYVRIYDEVLGAAAARGG